MYEKLFYSDEDIKYFLIELERDAANAKEDLLRHARNGDLELRVRVELARRVSTLHARSTALSEERVQVCSLCLTVQCDSAHFKFKRALANTSVRVHAARTTARHTRTATCREAHSAQREGFFEELIALWQLRLMFD